ncbi:MAG: linear amide C-N hydrolase [Thermodesulfobacteriota bacterium]
MSFGRGYRRPSAALFLPVLVLVALWPRPVPACTAFLIQQGDELAFGRNMDWTVGEALVMVNPRGLAKTAYLRPGHSGPPAAAWTSQFGSLTFNQFGREMPHGGLNEAGLTVALLKLPETAYGPPDERGAVNNLQWVQYQLDTAATVAEVLASEGVVRIGGETAALPQYLVCDQSGACAAVAFLEGRMVCHTGLDLPVKVLTNSPYPEALAFYRKHQGLGGTFPVPGGDDSLARFMRAANMVAAYHPEAANSLVDYAFSTLVYAAGWDTKWSLVYEPAGRKVHFRTFRNQEIRTVDFRALDFSCAAPALARPIDAGPAGDVSRAFGTYTTGLNLDLLREVYRKMQQWEDIPAPPEEVLLEMAAYPDQAVCRE